MFEQLSLFDIEPKETKFNFNRFAEDYCIHRGAKLSPGKDEEGRPLPAIWHCGFKNERPAKCWADWQPCNEENCPFIHGGSNGKEILL